MINREHFILLASLSAASLGLSYFLYMLQPAAAYIKYREFNVARGEGPRQIAAKLQEANLIRSRKIFTLYAALSGAAGRLKPGRYRLSPSQGAASIIEALKDGPEADIGVVVFEGETVADIDKKLSNLGIILPGELVALKPGDLAGNFSFLNGKKTLEGFLFPDTYRFAAGSLPEQVAKLMMENFARRALPALQAGGENWYDNLIIASLIEKEVPFSDERLIVSGIIKKRLSIGMPLQIDAAPETYDHNRLPAAPIANPGLDAINAALNPKPSPYLYYLSDPKTKRTIFSRDFEEHKVNKLRYLR